MATNYFIAKTKIFFFILPYLVMKYFVAETNFLSIFLIFPYLTTKYFIAKMNLFYWFCHVRRWIVLLPNQIFLLFNFAILGDTLFHHQMLLFHHIQTISDEKFRRQRFIIFTLIFYFHLFPLILTYHYIIRTSHLNNTFIS